MSSRNFDKTYVQVMPKKRFRFWVGGMSVLTLLLLTAVSRAGLYYEILENAYEIDEYQIMLNKDGTGSMAFHTCPEGCAKVKLPLTKQSQVFLDGEQKDKRFLNQSRHRPATVMYDPDSREITRVLFYDILK